MGSGWDGVRYRAPLSLPLPLRFSFFSGCFEIKCDARQEEDARTPGDSFQIFWEFLWEAELQDVADNACEESNI